MYFSIKKTKGISGKECGRINLGRHGKKMDWGRKKKKRRRSRRAKMEVGKLIARIKERECVWGGFGFGERMN